MVHRRDDDSVTDDAAPGHAADRVPAAERDRRARDEVFGDVLPDSTRDERGDSWGDRESSRDEDLLRDVPPHHS